jgi:polyphosphate kinase
MNSLCDREIIAALYKASAAGVEIRLIVRGICCLKTGIPGISDNISVRSLVGNFLEHARIFYFYGNGAEEVYMGSADWMPRNLDKRVEIVFPLTDPVCKKEAIRILQIQLSDNVKARTLQADGSYRKLSPDSGEAICAQQYFCEYAQKRARETENASDKRIFIPAGPEK